jgi:hypothetical protein
MGKRLAVDVLPEAAPWPFDQQSEACHLVMHDQTGSASRSHGGQDLWNGLLAVRPKPSAKAFNVEPACAKDEQDLSSLLAPLLKDDHFHDVK